MKKILLGLSALLSITTSVLADGLTVPAVSIQPGNTATVQVSLINSGESYRAVLFTLTLPAGISVVEDEFNEPVTIADAAIAAAGYSVSANQLTDNSYRFAVVSTSGDEIIPAECGPLFTFTIEAETTLATGTELTATLSEIKLTDAWAVDHQAANVDFSIAVEEARTILDETSPDAPEASDGPVDVRVLRTIKADEWSTICLPFAMTAEQIQAAFGENVTVQIADADSYETTEDDDENIVGINIKFNDVTAIEANHPYIIKVNKLITSFDVNGVAVAPATSEKNRRKQIGNRSYFIGNYENQTEVPEFCLYLSGNNFWYSIGDTKMKAFRAYFKLKDVLTEVDEAEARISFSFDEATGIKDNNRETITNNRYYDLQGRRVVKPGKGLYIRNGKKEMVK